MSTMRNENSTVRFAKGTRTVGSLKTHMYRPELHRQVTERVPVSRLGHELARLCQTGLGEPGDASCLTQARLELSELVDRISLSLKRNRLGLEIQSPVMLHCFTHWHVKPDTTVICLVPVAFAKAKVIQKDISNVRIKIPQQQQDPAAPTTATTATSTATTPKPTTAASTPAAAGESQSGRANTQSHSDKSVIADVGVRSRDGLHVSTRKLHGIVSNLVRSSLLKHGVSEEQIEINGSRVGVEYEAPACGGGDDLSMSVMMDCGWRAEFVPCVAVVTAPANGGGGGGKEGDGGGVKKKVRKGKASRNVDADAGLYYVSRKFHADSTSVKDDDDIDDDDFFAPQLRRRTRGDDLLWRPCFSAREQGLLDSISCTDSGLRVRALHVICRMLSQDWRLEHISCYDVQTVLLHHMDFHVDFSPRWQRSSLESAVRAMLKTLLYFVERESLPHFDMNQLNLWQAKTSRQMALSRGALARLLDNENALISLVRRASDIRSLRHSVDIGLLGF